MGLILLEVESVFWLDFDLLVEAFVKLIVATRDIFNEELDEVLQVLLIKPGVKINNKGGGSIVE